MCNYCATRGSRQLSYNVEMDRGSNVQVSTLDAVREIWRRGGDSNPR